MLNSSIMSKKTNRRHVGVIAILVAMIMVVVFLFNHFAKKQVLQNYEFLEISINPIEKVSDEDKEEVIKLLDTYYMEEEGRFLGIDIGSESKNIYCLEKIYYICWILQQINCDEYLPQLELVLGAASDYFEAGNLKTIDEVAYICLLFMTYGSSEAEEEMKTFIDRHTDDITGLLYEENSDDAIEEKINFTLEVIRLMDSVGAQLNNITFKDLALKQLKETVLLYPEEGNTIFNSGGSSIYTMYMLDNDYDFEEYKTWYYAWAEYYNTNDISSWDQFLDYKSSFLPIATAFGESDYANSRINQFLTPENIEDFINNSFDETFAYSFFGQVVEEFEDETKELLATAELSKLNYYYDRIRNYSMKDNYYGMELAYTIDWEYDIASFNRNCFDEYMQSLEKIIEENHSGDLDTFIETLYYFMLIDQSNTALKIETPEIDQNIQSEALLKTCSLIVDTEYKNPTMIRKFCECLSYCSQKVDLKFQLYMKGLLGDFSSNTNLVSSTYIIDFYVINQIMGYDYFDKNIVVENLDKLYVDGMYKYEPNDVYADLKTTFNVYCLGLKTNIIALNHEKNVDYNSLGNAYLTLEDGYYLLALKGL